MLKLLSKKSIGLDIADRSIELAEVVQKGNSYQVSAYARIRLTPNIVEKGRIKDAEKLQRAIVKLFQSAKPQAIEPSVIIFGLPESQVYTQVFTVLKAKQSEIEKIIYREIQKTIPIPVDEIVFDYRITAQDKDRITVLVVAAQKVVIKEWMDFFDGADIEVEMIDVESLALYRSLNNQKLEAPTCLVDVGASTSNILVFDQQGLRYSFPALIAGNTFTRSIAQSFKVSVSEAEELKKTIGLSDPSHKVYELIAKHAQNLVVEIQSALRYFKQQTGLGVDGIVVVGGTSAMKGFTEFISKEIGLAVEQGTITLPGTSKSGVLFIEAVGLALRGMNKKWNKQHPELLSAYQEATGEKQSSAKSSVLAANQSANRSSAVTQYTPKTKRKLISSLNSNLPKPISSRSSNPKLKKQLITLIGVLLIGAVLVVGAFQFRAREKSKSLAISEQQQQQFQLSQVLEAHIPVATTPEKYTPETLRAHVIDVPITNAESYADALEKARTIAEEQIAETEVVWKNQLNDIPTGDQFKLPTTFSLLIFAKKDANQLLLRKVDDMNVESVDYLLKTIDWISLEPTDDSKVYELYADIDLFVNSYIPEDDEGDEAVMPENNTEGSQEQTPVVEDTKQYVLITDTPTGWLNSRTGPGTIYPIVVRVLPGEKYELLKEDQKWYNIIVNTSTSAWIISDYAQKQ